MCELGARKSMWDKGNKIGEIECSLQEELSSICRLHTKSLGRVCEEVANLWKVDLNGPGHLIDGGKSEQFARELRCIDFHVFWNRNRAIFKRGDDLLVFARALFNGDDHSGFDLERTPVDFFAID